MEDYPANNQASRLPRQEIVEPKTSSEKKIEAVVTGAVSRRKKPLGKRFAETFFGGNLKKVAQYILEEVLLPAAKDTVADVVSQGIERMVYGEARSSSRRTGYRPGNSHGHVSYNRFSQGPPSSSRRDDPRPTNRRSRSPLDFDDIILATRAEA